MTIIVELEQFTDLQSTQDTVTDKPESTPCEEVRAARQRFLAKHGPGADLPRRHVMSKESRKALRAAEMARWECFHRSGMTLGRPSTR